jgi:hypothetical protein
MGPNRTYRTSESLALDAGLEFQVSYKLSLGLALVVLFFLVILTA